MTNEEVMRNVKTAFEWWEDNARMEEDEDWSRQHEALDIAIKALEQPSVTDFSDKCKECGKILNQDFIKKDTLEKIRAEIEQLRLHKAQFLTSDNKICIDSQEVLNIIDKYIAGSDSE